MGNFSEFVQKNTAQTKVVLYKTEMQRHEEHKTERKWQVHTHTIDKTVQCHAFLSHLLSVKVVLCFFTRLCPGNTLIGDIFIVKNTSMIVQKTCIFSLPRHIVSTQRSQTFFFFLIFLLQYLNIL